MVKVLNQDGHWTDRISLIEPEESIFSMEILCLNSVISKLTKKYQISFIIADEDNF
jgi:hypothetical protein